MELLTVQETAALLKVNPITVRRYISAGKLPAVKVGKGVRVRKEAVEQLITPVRPRRGRRKPVASADKVFTRNDALFSIIGIARGTDGVTDVSENKLKYLAEAYMPKQE